MIFIFVNVVFPKLFERDGGLLQSERFRLVQVASGTVVILLPDGQCASGINGLGRIARLGQVTLRTCEVAAAHGGVGSVQVGDGVVREHAYCGLEYFGELVRTWFILLCNEVELVQAQLLRPLTHDSFYLLHVAVIADGVGYAVVGAAQRRITVL